MSPLISVLIFLIMFAIVMMAISLGSRYLELRGKKQVESQLNPGSGEAEDAQITSILMNPEERDRIGTFPENSSLQAWMQTQIQQSGLQWNASQLLLAMVGGALVGGFLGFVLRPLGFLLGSIVLLGGLFGFLPLLYVRYKRAGRLKELEAQLPEALDFLARSMRAGHAFSISLEMLGTEQPDPLGQEFRALFAEHNLGAPIEVALQNFGRRVPLLDVRLFISSVSLQRQTGGNLSEVLTRLAFLIRERFRLRGQVKAASAHGRLTSAVLTVLPIVMIFALTFVAPDYLPQMARDPDGKWMIAAAVLFQVIGYLIMRRITNIKV
jgi:tight adherence protein B